MTTRIIVKANHGGSGATRIHIERRDDSGAFVPDPEPVVLRGPMQWHELWLPDEAQVVVSEHDEP